jgi:hypothetical protein
MGKPLLRIHCGSHPCTVFLPNLTSPGLACSDVGCPVLTLASATRIGMPETTPSIPHAFPTSTRLSNFSNLHSYFCQIPALHLLTSLVTSYTPFLLPCSASLPTYFQALDRMLRVSNSSVSGYQGLPNQGWRQIRL